jgi:hypothetical protein
MPIPSFEEEDVSSLMSLSKDMRHRVDGADAETSAMVDGKLVGECQFSWMAFIYIDRSTSEKVQGVCSGTLITNQHLLTAAHCFYLGKSGKPFDWKSVLNGSFVKVDAAYNASSPQVGQANFIESVSLPYADSWYAGDNAGLTKGDIALVKLRKPVPASKCISTICLPAKDYIQHGAGWYVAGYGSGNYSLWRGKFKVTDPRHWSDLNGSPLA